MFDHRRNSWSSWYQGEPHLHDFLVCSWTLGFSHKSDNWTFSFPLIGLCCWHHGGQSCVWRGSQIWQTSDCSVGIGMVFQRNVGTSHDFSEWRSWQSQSYYRLDTCIVSRAQQRRPSHDTSGNTDETISYYTLDRQLLFVHLDFQGHFSLYQISPTNSESPDDLRYLQFLREMLNQMFLFNFEKL